MESVAIFVDSGSFKDQASPWLTTLYVRAECKTNPNNIIIALNESKACIRSVLDGFCFKISLKSLVF